MSQNKKNSSICHYRDHLDLAVMGSWEQTQSRGFNLVRWWTSCPDFPWEWHRDVQFGGPGLSHEITLHNILEDENPATRAVWGSSGQSPAQAGAQIQGLLLILLILAKCFLMWVFSFFHLQTANGADSLPTLGWLESCFLFNILKQLPHQKHALYASNVPSQKGSTLYHQLGLSGFVLPSSEISRAVPTTEFSCVPLATSAPRSATEWPDG